jgi:hypothetical protein
VLGQRERVRAIEEFPGNPSGANRLRAVRFSPNGAYIAVRLGNAVGVFRRDGLLIKIVPGGLNGWSGNLGLLTLAERNGAITLFRHALFRRATRVIAVPFIVKGLVVADPIGRWFAYVNPLPTRTSGSPEKQVLYFHKADGSRPTTKSVGTAPAGVVGASARTGRVSRPLSAYSGCSAC